MPCTLCTPGACTVHTCTHPSHAYTYAHTDPCCACHTRLQHAHMITTCIHTCSCLHLSMHHSAIHVAHTWGLHCTQCHTLPTQAPAVPTTALQLDPAACRRQYAKFNGFLIFGCLSSAYKCVRLAHCEDEFCIALASKSACRKLAPVAQERHYNFTR